MRRFVSVSWQGKLQERAQIELTESVSHHVRNVLRLSAGDEIELCDGFGYSGAGTIKSIDPDIVEIDEITFHPRETELVVFVALLKKDRWAWMLEKLTEIGVSDINPIEADRSVVKWTDKNAERARKIFENATRQSDQYWVPQIAEPISIAQAIALPYDHVVGSFYGDRKKPTGKNLALWIGPEGGFTQDEFAQITSFATPWTFSSHVLRAETAAVLGAGILLSDP